MKSQVVGRTLSPTQPFQNRTAQRAPGGQAPGESGTHSLLDAFGRVENNKLWYVFRILVEIIEPMRIWARVFHLLNFLYSYHQSLIPGETNRC